MLECALLSRQVDFIRVGTKYKSLVQDLQLAQQNYGQNKKMVSGSTNETVRLIISEK